MRFHRLSPARVLIILLLAALAGCAGTPRPTQHAAITLDPAMRGNFVLTAMAMLDTRYHYGGSSPDTGFDCSGLVVFAARELGVAAVPRNAAELASVTRPVQRSQLSAGDLVFFNTLNRPFSHVGIYLGDGNFINAPSSGGRVRIDQLDNRYFAARFDGARSFFRH